MILVFFWDLSELFFIEKVMDLVYGSRDHNWLSIHSGLVTMGRRSRSGARKIIATAWRERQRGGRWSSHQWCHLEAEL
jgi:hypothetical protein